MGRFHVWVNADCWDENPEKSGAEFLGLCDDVEKIINFATERLDKKEWESKESYAVVTMGDMSPAGLASTGGADPDDLCVEWIGRYTSEEAEELMPEWEKKHAEELAHGCWINTVYDEHPDVGVLCEDFHVWDTEEKVWRGFDDCSRDIEHWRKKLTEAAKYRPYDETSIPIPDGGENQWVE